MPASANQDPRPSRRKARPGGWGIGVALGLLAAAVAGNMAAARRAERKNPPRGRFVEVDGVRLRYLEAGSGPPIALIHGNGVSADDYVTSGLFDALAAHHRVIAIDRPGFGYSPRPKERIWTAGAQAELMMQALARLDVKQPLVVGHSWGTLVALNMALDHPDGVQGLVLISGYYVPGVRLDSALAAGPATPGLGAVLRYTVSPLLGRLMAASVIKLLFSPAKVTERFRADYSIGMAVRPSQLQAVSADGAMMVSEAKRVQSRIGELRQPVLLIAGRGDKIASFKGQAERFARQLPHAELLAIHGAGHMVHHVATEEVADAIGRFARSAATIEAKVLPAPSERISAG